MNPNNYPRMNQNQDQNQAQNKPNGNQKLFSNKKYADFEIQTFFQNDNKLGLSARDMTLKGDLEVITNQYMATFDTINELSKKFSHVNENMYKVDMIKQNLDQIDFQTSNEYGNFLRELYDITKNTSVTSLTYDKFKRDRREGEQKLKQIISDYKYDIILNTNKNSTQANYKRLSNYVDEQKRKNYYNNYNYDRNDYNQNYSPAPSQNNYNNNQSNGSNYYNDYNNGGEYGNNYNNYNQGNGNNKYYNNYGNNDYNYNNYSGKIRVKFIVNNGRETYHEFDPNASGEELYLYALQEREEPKIYTKKGRYLRQAELRETKIKDVFAECEPILNVY